VDLATQISGMHRSMSQHIIISAAVASDVDVTKFGRVSVGRHMLRPVDQPQEPFTISETE